MNVGSAAGADVVTRNGNYPHPPAELLFASVGNFFKLLRRRIAHLNGQVFIDRLVGFLLEKINVLLRKWHVKVNGRKLKTEVEPHVVGAEV